MTPTERSLATLRQHGIAGAPLPSLTSAEVAQIMAHLSGATVFNAHVEAKATESTTLADALARPAWPMLCHRMADVVAAPYLFTLALRLHGLVQDYFDGEQPRLYSMNAFWTQPAPGPEYQDTHGWHRDGDDRKQLVMFMLGTDVPGVGDGAHLYQRGTHRIADADLGRDFREPSDEIVETVTGRAGMIFIADTGGLHVGLRPQRWPRMLAWARWGVSDPPQSYVWDRLKPIPRAALGMRYPVDPVLREAVKLVVC